MVDGDNNPMEATKALGNLVVGWLRRTAVATDEDDNKG